jgi:AcrR family transcriptional regulator
MTTPPSTRDRLIAAAATLFGERGYRTTTVGSIERAAGLSPRSGGFYKHFASKQDVLEAVFDRWVRDVEGLPQQIAGLLPLHDLRAELTVIARGVLQVLARQRPLFQLLARDAQDFPGLVRRTHEQLVSVGYSLMTEWFRDQLEARGRPDADARALAAVALAALAHYRQDEVLYGVPPGGVDEEEFVQAWVATWATALGADGHAR